MTIGGVSCGERSAVAQRGWQDWMSVGISTSGAITRQDFGKRLFYIPVVFNLMPTATVTSLETALKSAGKWGGITVVPDANDDLGIGAGGSVTLLFVQYGAEYIPNGYHRVSITFAYFA